MLFPTRYEFHVLKTWRRAPQKPRFSWRVLACPRPVCKFFLRGSGACHVTALLVVFAQQFQWEFFESSRIPYKKLAVSVWYPAHFFWLRETQWAITKQTNRPSHPVFLVSCFVSKLLNRIWESSRASQGAHALTLKYCRATLACPFTVSVSFWGLGYENTIHLSGPERLFRTVAHTLIMANPWVGKNSLQCLWVGVYPRIN